MFDSSFDRRIHDPNSRSLHRFALTKCSPFFSSLKASRKISEPTSKIHSLRLFRMGKVTMKFIVKALATTALSMGLLLSSEAAFAKKSASHKSASSHSSKSAKKSKSKDKKSTHASKKSKKKKHEHVAELPEKKSSGYARAATYMGHRKPANSKSSKSSASKKSKKKKSSNKGKHSKKKHASY